MSSWKSFSVVSPGGWLEEECFQEMTILDDTCDSPLPGCMPATPVTAGSMNRRFTSLQLSSSTDLNATAQIPCSQKKTLDLLKSDLNSPKAESQTFDAEPSRQNGSETRSSHGAQEDNSEVHSPEVSRHNRTVSTDPDDKMVDPSESMYSPMCWRDVRHIPDITLLDVTRESEVSHGGELSSTEVTQGSILENNRPSPEPSGSNMVKMQTSAEEIVDTHHFNVTHNISSSSAVSVQCAASQFSTSDMQCSTSSKNVTSELRGEPPVTVNTVEANNEDPLTSHDAELTSKETQPCPNASGSVNSTLTSLQPSQLSCATDLSTTAQIPCPKNTTLNLPSSNVNGPKAESEATSVSKNTTETSLVINQTFSAVKATGSSDMRNATFDGHSLHKSSGNTFSGDAGAAILCLQNNTFDTKPKQNGTMTLSETSSSDSRHNTFDKSTPLEFCHATSSPKENNSEDQTPEHKGTFSSTDPNTKMVDTPESTFEVNPAVEVASGADQRETKDQSPSGLPLTDGLSETLGHQNMDMENNEANPFNLDDTLDIRPDALITSTPMTTSKGLSINTQQEKGKSRVGPKKLCVYGATQPDGQVPSNIACEQKTLVTHPAAKSLLPLSRAASQLLRHKPASTLSGRFDAMTSGLPMTRQRTHAEALRNAAAPTLPQTTGKPSFYKLRASTTGPKQPNSGLQRPQLSGIPSGIQRTATGLRAPSARSNAAAAAAAAASSNTNGLRGPPAATNPVTKTSHAKKQLLSRGDALPIAKRKRIDCANCVKLEQEVKMQSEEIQRLREELLEKK